MLRLLGYTDRLSAAPGDTVRFMVSSEAPSYQARLVRLIHGDENPLGPGFKQEPVTSSIDGEYPGRRQEIPGGSSANIPVPAGTIPAAFTFVTFLQPTNPGQGEQVIAARGDPFGTAGGWALALSDGGALEFVAGTPEGPVRLAVDTPVERWAWYFVGAALEGGRLRLWQQAIRRWPGDRSNATLEAAVPTLGPDTATALRLAAVDSPLPDGVPRSGRPLTRLHLDGRLDRPRLLRGAIDGPTALALGTHPDDLGPFGDGVLGAWDFSRDMSSDRISDTSGLARHGRLVNMPTRGVTGYNFSGRVRDWTQAPDEYGAIHFHRDDLEDACWDVAFELTIPDDLPSGVYAAWLRAGDDEDHIPFTVRPRKGTTRSRIAVLMSTMTYLTYENFTDIGRDAWRDEAYQGDVVTHPLADPGVFRDVFRYIAEHDLYGLYDVHVDGSGMCFGSILRPILNMRPKFRYRSMDCPARLPADLYQVDWLREKGIEADFITDHDLHAEGADLLRGYTVIVSSSHPEYWTAPMLDAMETYLGEGGRFMYLGANGLFGVLSVDPEKPHVIELRRWGTGWPFEVPPAERHHSTTGEPGGTWRNRGRAPNTIVGVGTAGAGFDRGSPLRRQPDSYDDRAAWIFDGVEGDLIGDQPNLQVRWGAAGYEFDRVETELGSPATTLRLASSVRFNASHLALVDDEMWFAQGRDGAGTGDAHVAGVPHRFARADMAYLEYPNGGAVFSAGAICWRGALFVNGYENSVSRVTENVLRRFADPAWRRG